MLVLIIDEYLLNFSGARDLNSLTSSSNVSTDSPKSLAISKALFTWMLYGDIAHWFSTDPLSRIALLKYFCDSGDNTWNCVDELPVITMLFAHFSHFKPENKFYYPHSVQILWFVYYLHQRIQYLHESISTLIVDLLIPYFRNILVNQMKWNRAHLIDSWMLPKLFVSQLWNRVQGIDHCCSLQYIHHHEYGQLLLIFHLVWYQLEIKIEKH